MTVGKTKCKFVGMKKTSLYGIIILLFASAIWGFAFVAQSQAMDNLEPFTFYAMRSIMAVAVLIPFVLIRDGVAKKRGTYVKTGLADRKTLLLGGLFCGIALTVASCFQQFGICYTTASNAGFLTAMYILLVPILGIFMRKKIPAQIWICVGIALVGMYFLCMGYSFSINRGDVLSLISAFFFSIQIMLVDYYAPKTDGVKLSILEFSVAAIICIVLMFVFEKPSWDNILKAWMPIVYAGVFSSGIAYTLQIVGQKYAPAYMASLAMSLESVFATIGGIMVLEQYPMPKEWIGIGLMLAAIILSQIKFNKKIINRK